MVVLVVEVASDGATLRRGNPKVGAAGVEDDLELLRRVTNSNLGEVCNMVRRVTCVVASGLTYTERSGSC